MKFNRIIVALAIVVMVAVVGTGVALAQSAPTPSIIAPANNSTFDCGEEIDFSGSASGGTSPYSYVWTFGDGSSAFGENFSKAYNNGGTFTARLTVTGNDTLNDSQSISVTILSNCSATQLVISNVRVTDVTQTSAIVRWDTNLPANSRVIYDTVSHPSITGASAPNYGYANSSATLDNSPKVTSHVVNLTGLSANTKYYFRVISEE